MQDIRDVIFHEIRERKYHAVLLPEADGVLSGVEDAARKAAELGLEWRSTSREGGILSRNESFAELVGTPKQLALAEECIIGLLSKPSGIATAARRAVSASGGRVRIVSGSWKKMPPDMKTAVRRAIVSGGASFRICEQPMLYLDKNFIRMFGSIRAALEAAAGLKEITKVVQIKGIDCSIEEETRQAVKGGADILMVDTGNPQDVKACRKQMAAMPQEKKRRVAFAGNVKIAQIPSLAEKGIDILCIGKEIVDAGLLDMKLNVLGAVEE